MDSTADRIRGFNRFYTDLIGSLRKKYLDSPFSLPEARVVFEIGTTPGITATEIRARAHYDQGHLSRILARLESDGIVTRSSSKNDKRARALRLTPHGDSLLETMQQRARDQAHDMVHDLTREQRAGLLDAMDTIQRLLDPTPDPSAITIREGRPGDPGHLLHRHATLYQQEFGYDERFEMYVAQGLASYLENKDPTRDRLWVAERNGRQVGTIAIHHTNERPGWAKLRWYLVEQEARGQGLGKTLIDEAVSFARNIGYKGIFLWTVSNLDAARRQYERAGFTLIKETPTCPWAPWAKEQMWELELQGPGGTR